VHVEALEHLFFDVSELAPTSDIAVFTGALGTKNRQKQTADICKQHLREKYRDKLGLVEEFI
jgi:hypothetical protein